LGDSKNTIIVGLIVVVGVAIVLSAVSMIMVSDLNHKITSLLTHEADEHLEVGAPGIAKNEFYIFTQELDADEEKVGVPVAVYSLTQIVVHKGDTVKIHFFNAAEEKDDRHTFTMQSPYEMNYDLAGGEDTTFSFEADKVGTFTYFCTYDLPSMVGKLIVLP
jgi:plastocyanin